MKISVLGLGYVGTVLSACLCKLNHNVIGVDIKPSKVDLINQGKSPIYENDLNALIKNAVSENKLIATVDVNDAIKNSQVTFVCVGTPSNENGSINLGFMLRTCEQIGEALKNKKNYHLVAIRSTITPGTIEENIIPLIEEISGKKVSIDFDVCMNPEFLREGSAVQDFFNPERTVIGTNSLKVFETIKEVYNGIDKPIIMTDIRTGEMMKYIDNSFHALKVCFTNEIGRICKHFGADAQKAMEIFCMDKKQNLSEYYFKPGFAYGGSCLPKDVRALIAETNNKELMMPLIRNIPVSNIKHIDCAVDLIKEITIFKNITLNRVGILGLSFKKNTDDFRENPILQVIDKLKNHKILIYDKLLTYDDVGKISYKLSLMFNKNLKYVLKNSDVIVIANNGNYDEVYDLLENRHKLIDLQNVLDKKKIKKGDYYRLT